MNRKNANIIMITVTVIILVVTGIFAIRERFKQHEQAETSLEERREKLNETYANGMPGGYSSASNKGASDDSEGSEDADSNSQDNAAMDSSDGSAASGSSMADGSSLGASTDVEELVDPDGPEGGVSGGDYTIYDPNAHYAPADDYVTCTGDTLNLRTVPSTEHDSRVIASIKKGEAVHRTAIGENGWSRLEYDGQTVYAVTQFLTTVDPNAITPEPTARAAKPKKKTTKTNAGTAESNTTNAAQNAGAEPNAATAEQNPGAAGQNAIGVDPNAAANVPDAAAAANTQNAGANVPAATANTPDAGANVPGAATANTPDASANVPVATPAEPAETNPAANGG